MQDYLRSIYKGKEISESKDRLYTTVLPSSGQSVELQHNFARANSLQTEKRHS